MIKLSEPPIGEEEIAAVAEVVRSGHLAMGANVRAFEKEFAAYLGCKHAIALNSGTAALQLGIQALEIPEHSEVITTPFTFIASSNALLYNKLTPVFADIGDDFTIDPSAIEACITEKTKAVLVVHLFGNPCNMSAIEKLCKEHGLLLIEDCAQAPGAVHAGKRVGNFGDIACFSFYATKNITTGEGGMVTGRDSAAADIIKVVRNQGQKGMYEHVAMGYNFRMAELQAALGRVQLKKLDALNGQRRENAQYLRETLRDVKGLALPAEARDSRHVFHQFTIRVLNSKRDALMKQLADTGIEAKIFYPKPVYLQPVYRGMGYRTGLCPRAEEFSEQVLSIPVHPHLTQEELEQVGAQVKEFFQ